VFEPSMLVEIWSDLVCPWCAIGKARFERALERFEHRTDVEVVWRSFELDPSAPTVRDGSNLEHLARKYGVSTGQAAAMQQRVVSAAEAEGLTMRFDLARAGNTFDAHRLVHLAAAHDRQHELYERLLRAYFAEGEPIGDRSALRRLAVEVGLDPPAVDDVLTTDRFAEAVRADEAGAAELGVRGVPFFVVDRAFGVSGAQSTDLFLEVLTEAWAARAPTA
jgi:predicted DsbA family dithiol-disulfide isomerase